MEAAAKQREDALAEANRVRFSRAKLKRQLSSRRRNPIRVMERPPDYAEAMRIETLLSSVPGLGKNKVYRLLRRCEVNPSTKLRDLTKRQKLALAQGIKEKTWNG